jgi:hypothetical protein
MTGDTSWTALTRFVEADAIGSASGKARLRSKVSRLAA